MSNSCAPNVSCSGCEVKVLIFVSEFRGNYVLNTGVLRDLLMLTKLFGSIYVCTYTNINLWTVDENYIQTVAY